MNTRWFRLTTLSPVHVGCGAALSSATEMVTESDVTYILDVEAAIRAYPDFFERHRGRAPRPADLLRHLREVGGDALIRKVKPAIRAQELLLQMRDGRGAALIPGSTLKGAIRTVLFWLLARKMGGDAFVRQSLERLGSSSNIRAKFAAQDLEKAMFRGSSRSGAASGPHNDLLRALLVGDCCLDPATVGVFEVHTRSPSRERRDREEDYVLACEGVGPGAQGVVRIGLDEFLLQPERRRDAGLPDGVFNDFREVASASREYLLQTIEIERDYFQRSPFADAVAFLETLHAQIQSAGPETWFLRLGWGIGWCGTTGAVATPEDRLALLRMFEEAGHRISKWSAEAYENSGMTFPKTRRYARNARKTPLFGFVKLEPTDERAGVEPFSPIGFAKPAARAPKPPGPAVQRSAVEAMVAAVRPHELKGRFDGLLRTIEALEDQRERSAGLRALWEKVQGAIPAKDKFHTREDVMRLRREVSELQETDHPEADGGDTMG